jgi:hypothetical protein
MHPIRQPQEVHSCLQLLPWNTNTRHLAVNLLLGVVPLNSPGLVFLQVLGNSLSIWDLSAVGRLPILKDIEKGNSEQIGREPRPEGLLLGYTCWKALLFLWNSAISSFCSETKFSPIDKISEQNKHLFQIISL